MRVAVRGAAVGAAVGAVAGAERRWAPMAAWKAVVGWVAVATAVDALVAQAVETVAVASVA